MTTLARLLPQHWIPPDYAGGSLSSLPPTVGALLGVQAPWQAAPLKLAAGDGVRQVVLLLVDGLGQLRLTRQLRQEDAGLHDLLVRYGASSDGGLPPPLTSVSPSTTTAATSVLQADGRGPGGLGLVGFTQLLPSLGVVANMLFFNAAYDRGARIGDLEGWGVTPESMFGAPTIYQLLAASGVSGTAFAPSAINRNPLSRMQFQGANVIGYVDWSDMLARLGGHLEASAGQRGFSYAYMPDFDSIMHRDGSDSPSISRLFEAFVPQLRRLLDDLSPAARRGTLILITADHGHMSCPEQQRHRLQQHPAVLKLLGLPPAGEPRHVFLYARAGALDQLYDAARRELSDWFVVLKGAEALEAGLYGDPATLHPEAHLRVGDVVVLAKGGATLWHEESRPGPLGMHGSLEPDEMLVPLLALRADA